MTPEATITVLVGLLCTGIGAFFSALLIGYRTLATRVQYLEDDRAKRAEKLEDDRVRRAETLERDRVIRAEKLEDSREQGVT